MGPDEFPTIFRVVQVKCAAFTPNHSAIALADAAPSNTLGGDLAGIDACLFFSSAVVAVTLRFPARKSFWF